MSHIFFLLFEDDTLLKAVAIALNDFSSFDQMSPVAYLLEVGDHNVCSVISICLIQYIICLVSNGEEVFLARLPIPSAVDLSGEVF